MLNKAQALQDKLTTLRRTIHLHPELGFEEIKTAGLVAETLASLDIEYQSGVGKTGVVARLGNGNGPVIGIRADMDALPIEEANDVEYKSQVAGKMHACGHDAHTAMLLSCSLKFDRTWPLRSFNSRVPSASPVRIFCPSGENARAVSPRFSVKRIL